jgi:acyl-CoA synthetase (AMP-forming)/AMP-acid ligase II
VIAGGNSIDLAVTLLGTMTYGAIAAPLNPKLTPHEVAIVVAHAGARVALAEPGIALPGTLARIGSIAAWRDAAASSVAWVDRPITGDSPALLIYSAGTSGRPKGALLHHRSLVANVRTAIEGFAFARQHRTLCLLPLFHTFGLVSDVLPMLFVGGSVVIAPVFDVARLVELEHALIRHRVRSFSAVPLIFDLMLRLGMRFDSSMLRFCVSGAAPLYLRVVAEFRERHGVTILPAYSMTETTCFRGDHAHGGGHLRDGPAAWREGDRRELRTGDLGFGDGAGWLHITGRAKNVVIRGAEMIYLEDLDRAIAGLAGVGDAASVGVVRGELERIVAFVVRAEPSLDERAVRDHLVREVGAAKLPDVIVFCDAIPRTATRKVKIAALQALAEAHL